MNDQPKQPEIAPGIQALVNIVTQQRDAAMNALAQAQASLAVVSAAQEAAANELSRLKSSLALVSAERDALKAQLEAPAQAEG